MRKPDGQTFFLGAAVLFALALAVYIAFSQSNGVAGGHHAAKPLTLADIPFDGQRAYTFLRDVCELGRRPSGSVGMTRQQEMLTRHFEQLGGQVQLQPFRVRHPNDGSPVSMANLIVQWHPDRKQRILLCAHYDTRPYPDRDPDRSKRRGVFVGANDGASGVALLAELAHHMPSLESRYGVDFVLFDGEEFVFDEKRDQHYYFLGSKHFARQYIENPPDYQYRFGVLVDMVGDRNLELYYEGNSARWRDTKPLVREIWSTAAQLGVRGFIPRVRHTVRDDHLALHDIARIPTCDIIDMDYPASGLRRSYWHTTQDTADKCSALSLAKVGWVLHEWLKRLQ